ncbi:MAG: transcriptional regulator [Acidobacteria bacterium]|nr:MAG: transcriptional regulator [Acidobacteriota bacterium]
MTPTGPSLPPGLLEAPWTAQPAALEALVGDADAQLGRVAEALFRRLAGGDRLSVLVHGPPGSGRGLLVAAAIRRAAAAVDRPVHEAWLDGRLVGGPPVALLTEAARFLMVQQGDPRQVGRLAALHDLPPGAAEKAAMGLIDDLLGGDHLLLVLEGVDFLPTSVSSEGWLHVTEWIARSPRIGLVGLSDPVERRRADLDFEDWFAPKGGHAETFRARPVERDAAAHLAARAWSLAGRADGPPDDLPAVAALLHRLTGGRRRWLLAAFEARGESGATGPAATARAVVSRLAGELALLLERISPQQRRLLAALADARRALTVRELARRTFCSSQAVSSQLGQLRGSEAVLAERVGRETFYRIADPLLAAFLELRAGNAPDLDHEVRFIDAVVRHRDDPSIERVLAALYRGAPEAWRQAIPGLLDRVRRGGRPGALAAALAALARDAALIEADPGRAELWRDLWAEWSGREPLVACAVQLIDAALHAWYEGPVRARARLSPLLVPEFAPTRA